MLRLLKRGAAPALALAFVGACGSGGQVTEAASTDRVAPPIAERLATADPRKGAMIFNRCTACHTIGAGAPDVDGPNLYGVMGAAIAERRPRFAYTAALRNLGGTWDDARMDAWLTSPRRFAPGTRMTFGGIPDPAQRADLIAWLHTQGPRP